MVENSDLIDAVNGEKTGDFGEDEFENALFQHNTSAKLFHPEAPKWADGDVALGLDLKQTPNGEWKVIELMSRNFGSKGYSNSYHWGDISLGTVTLGYNDLSDTLDFVDNKRKSSEVLPSGRTTESVDDYLRDNSDQIIYLKAPEDDGGTGVEVMRASDLDEGAASQLVDETGVEDISDLLVEERVPSTTETVRGEEHDRTMRYAVLLDSVDGGLDLTFKGGYWKVAPEPVDSDASLNERYLANLKNGFSRPADFRELREATEASMRVAQEVFSAAIQKRRNGEVNANSWSEYGDEIGHHWQDPYMEWTAYDTEGGL